MFAIFLLLSSIIIIIVYISYVCNIYIYTLWLFNIAMV